jgi:hypothetical protein
MEQALHTDANELAGLFEEVFGRDLTANVRICQHCHRHHQVGAHPLFRGAGMVVRCPSCGHLAAAIVPLREGHAVSLHGAWMLD